MSSRPVAKGSSVPACPVFAPVMRRICATIANDDGPAGLSTSATPDGSSARGGTLSEEPFADDLRDVVDGLLAREAGRLTVPTAAEDARDGRHVQLVDARAQRHAPRRPALARRLPDQHRELCTFDRAQVVDDPLRVRLGGADVGEVGADEIRDDDATSLEDLRTL